MFISYSESFFFFSGCFVQFMVRKILCQVLYILLVMRCTIQCANAASSPSPSSASSSFTFEEFMTQRGEGQDILKSAVFKANKKKKEDGKQNVENIKTRDQKDQVKFARMISFQLIPMSFPPIALCFNACTQQYLSLAILLDLLFSYTSFQVCQRNIP